MMHVNQFQHVNNFLNLEVANDLRQFFGCVCGWMIGGNQRMETLNMRGTPIDCSFWFLFFFGDFASGKFVAGMLNARKNQCRVSLQRCAIWPWIFSSRHGAWKICSRDLCPTIWPDPDPKNPAKKIDQGTFQMLGTDVHKMCLKPVWPPFCTTDWKHPVVHMHLLCLKPVWHPFCTVHWRHPVVHMHRLYFKRNVWQPFCPAHWKHPVAHVHLLCLQIVWRPFCAAHWIVNTQWRRCTWFAWKKKCGGIQWCTCTCSVFKLLCNHFASYIGSTQLLSCTGSVFKTVYRALEAPSGAHAPDVSWKNVWNPVSTEH